MQLLDVVRIEAQADLRVRLEFENGERRGFAMAPLLDKQSFARPRNPSLFRQAGIDYGTVVWPGNIDIDPGTHSRLSIPV